MPEACTVWAVDLIREPKKDRRGTLSLEPSELLFEPVAQGANIRIPLSSVRKVRRLRGSPVLLVVHAEGGVDRRTAFYFVQPPPLEPVLGLAERPTPLSMGRLSRRRARRRNVGYLGVTNRSKRDEVEAWAKGVREAVEGVSG